MRSYDVEERVGAFGMDTRTETCSRSVGGNTDGETDNESTLLEKKGWVFPFVEQPPTTLTYCAERGYGDSVSLIMWRARVGLVPAA